MLLPHSWPTASTEALTIAQPNGANHTNGTLRIGRHTQSSAVPIGLLCLIRATRCWPSDALGAGAAAGRGYRNSYWRGLKISEFKRRQLEAIRDELEGANVKRTAPVVCRGLTASSARYPASRGLDPGVHSASYERSRAFGARVQGESGSAHAGNWRRGDESGTATLVIHWRASARIGAARRLCPFAWLGGAPAYERRGSRSAQRRPRIEAAA